MNRFADVEPLLTQAEVCLVLVSVEINLERGHKGFSKALLIELLFLVGVPTLFEEWVTPLHGENLLLLPVPVTDGPFHFHVESGAMNLDHVDRDREFAMGRADRALSQRNLVVQRDHEKLQVGYGKN